MRLGLIRMADPLTLTLSPNTEYVLEEREELVGMPPRAAREATAVSQLLPRACPGLQPVAPLGRDEEEAASCRFTNIQSPDSVLITSLPR